MIGKQCAPGIAGAAHGTITSHRPLEPSISAYMNVALQNPSHKRTRPIPQKWGSQDNLPPLPKISGDIILQVFTHRSLQRSHGGTLEDNSDNQRLAVLGKAALEAVVTHLLFKHKPSMLATSEIRVRIPPRIQYLAYLLLIRAERKVFYPMRTLKNGWMATI